jgi:hypothetical protein
MMLIWRSCAPERTIMSEALATDLLEGVSAIAAFIGKDERRTRYLIQRGLLPAFRQGRRWNARKSKLVAFYDELERKAAKKQ